MDLEALIQEAVEQTAQGNCPTVLDLYSKALSSNDCTIDCRVQCLSGMCRTLLRSERPTEAYSSALDYIDLCPTDIEPYLYAAASLFVQAQLGGKQCESRRRRGQAFAACAIQLDSYARQHYLWGKYELTEPANVQLVKVCSDADSGAFKPLDQVLCYAQAAGSVILLEAGQHAVTCGLFLHPITMLGMGKRGTVQVALQRRLMGSDNTFENRCRGSSPVIMENVYVSCTENHAVYCIDGHLQLYNCRLSNSGSSGMPVAAAGNRACLTLNNCEVSGSKAAGGVMAHSGGTVELEGCKVFNNAKSGLEAIDGGTLAAVGCSIYANRQGTIVWQEAGQVSLTDCSIYNHTNEGVLVSHCQKGGGADLLGCRVYNNGNYGVSVDDKGRASMKRCAVFENMFWGVIVKSNSTLSMDANEVYSNKCGGVYLGFNGNARVELSNNHIHHNAGQGFADIFNTPSAEGAAAVKAIRKIPLQRKVELAREGMLSSTKKPVLSGNVVENNAERNEHPTRLSDWQLRCSMCQCKVAEAKPGSSQEEGTAEMGGSKTEEDGVKAAPGKLKVCSGCLTTRYCSAQCQRDHWKRHRPTCELLRKKHEIEVDLKSDEERFGTGRTTVSLSQVKGQRRPKVNEGPLGKGRKSAASSYPKKCIVKIQTDENNVDPKQLLLAYNEDRSISGWFASPSLFHLIYDKGVLGCNGFTSKKVFLNAVLEAEGKLRILTHELAPYKSW